MEWLITSTLVVSSLLGLLQQGLCQNVKTSTLQSSIMCYVCNSMEDPRCGHPFDKSSFAPLNCSDLVYMSTYNQELMKETEKKDAPNLCRKNIQTVTLGGKTDYRIVRSCGFMPKNKPKYGVEVDEDDTIGEDRCYKRAGTFEVAVTYCTCTHDDCNGALRTGTGGSFLSVTLLVVAVAGVGSRLLNLPK